MVFQHSRPLNRQTVLENIMVALLPDSLFMLFADKALTERARWIAERVGLLDVDNRDIGRQRAHRDDRRSGIRIGRASCRERVYGLV